MTGTDERSAARVFATLLREPTFEDAVVYIATASADKHLKQMRLHVKNGNELQAALSEAKASEWEKLLIELQQLARKNQVGE